MNRTRSLVAAALSAILAVPVWLLAVTSTVAAAHASSAGTVYINTVPALAGVGFDVRGAFVTTNGGGAAVVSLSDINGVASDISLSSPAVPGGDTVSINRIVPAPHVPHESHL